MLYLSRAAFVTQLVSTPVIAGFVSGSAFLSASTQVKRCLLLRWSCADRYWCCAPQFSTLLGVPKCGKANSAGLGAYACTFYQACANAAANHASVRHRLSALRRENVADLNVYRLRFDGRRQSFHWCACWGSWPGSTASHACYPVAGRCVCVVHDAVV